jgi:hypothetical protein
MYCHSSVSDRIESDALEGALGVRVGGCVARVSMLI